MIDLDYISSFFPPTIAGENRFDRYMLKEYLQLMILDHLASTPFITKLTFGLGLCRGRRGEPAFGLADELRL